ncbi:MAG: hypothetical protein LBK76_08710 [Verrucomicrobiales bacterium]|jgi:hypothetical protein|nr:hypothetical protein [Verrucomicrobiales bacterium]
MKKQPTNKPRSEIGAALDNDNNQLPPLDTDAFAELQYRVEQWPECAPGRGNQSWGLYGTEKGRVLIVAAGGALIERLAGLIALMATRDEHLSPAQRRAEAAFAASRGVYES